MIWDRLSASHYNKAMIQKEKLLREALPADVAALPLDQIKDAVQFFGRADVQHDGTETYFFRDRKILTIYPTTICTPVGLDGVRSVIATMRYEIHKGEA